MGEFGRGFDVTNLTRMMKFAEAFPDEKIVASLSQQLSWSHFRELLPLEHPLQREFYAEMSRVEGLELDAAGILVAEYLTVFPPREVLQRKLQEAIAAARLRFDSKEDVSPIIVT